MSLRHLSVCGHLSDQLGHLGRCELTLVRLVRLIQGSVPVLLSHARIVLPRLQRASLIEKNGISVLT